MRAGLEEDMGLVPRIHMAEVTPVPRKPPSLSGLLGHQVNTVVHIYTYRQALIHKK